MGVNVYAVHLNGSYFMKPKWATMPRRHGRVQATLSSVMRAEEVNSLSAKEIFTRVQTAISHDEYRWQEQARIPFYAKKKAERLDHLLYKCPRCKAEFTLVTKDDRLFCTACGNAARMDNYGFLQSETSDCSIFRYVSDWVEYQRACIREDADKEGFSIVTKAELQLHLNQHSLSHTTVGEGTVRLDREALTYEGTRNGETVSLTFLLANMFKLPFSSGVNFEVPNPAEVVAFVPQDRRMISKFVLAVPVLRERL
jgi:ribosomal protein S27AE